MITITLDFSADPQTVQTNIKFDRSITKTELEYFSDVINGLLSVAVDYESAGKIPDCICISCGKPIDANDGRFVYPKWPDLILCSDACYEKDMKRTAAPDPDGVEAWHDVADANNGK